MLNNTWHTNGSNSFVSFRFLARKGSGQQEPHFHDGRDDRRRDHHHDRELQRRRVLQRALIRSHFVENRQQ